MICGVVKPQLVPHGGSADKLGATVTAEGINFAVYSETASALFVSLYDEADREIGALRARRPRQQHPSRPDRRHRPRRRNTASAPMGRTIRTRACISIPTSCWSIPMRAGSTASFVRSPRLRLPRSDAEDTAPLVPKAVVHVAAAQQARDAAPQGAEPDVRAQCARLHHAPSERAGAAARHHRRAHDAPRHRSPQIPRRRLRRADADRRLHRRRPSAGARAHQCLGLQSGRLFRDRSAARAARAAGAALPHRPLPQERHFSDPRRGLQPHRRGRQYGPGAEPQGARRQDLLPARRSRRQAGAGQRRRHRQHAALRSSGGAAAGDREPALLGRGDRRLRLPLRSRDRCSAASRGSIPTPRCCR